MCRRKLGYINEGDDNVDKKKKKNNKRNNNDSNDEIKAIEEEKKKLTNALADLYSRCKNSTDTYHLQFNPSLYGCFVDKYIEDKLKVGSTLRRIVEILLDNPRRSWKCIDTNSLIFNNDEVKWLNSSLNKKKKNQKVKSVFADLNIYVEVVRIKQVRILFIYNDNVGFNWSTTSAHGVKATTAASWLRHDPFGKKVRKRFEFAHVDDNDNNNSNNNNSNANNNNNNNSNANNNNNNDKNLLDFNLKELEEAFNKYQELVDATYKKITGEKCKKGFRYISKKDGNYIMFSESENRKNINESGLDKFFELLVNLTASEDNSIFIIDYMLNMYQRKKKDTTKLAPNKILLLSAILRKSNTTREGMEVGCNLGICKSRRVIDKCNDAIIQLRKEINEKAIKTLTLEKGVAHSVADNYACIKYGVNGYDKKADSTSQLYELTVARNDIILDMLGRVYVLQNVSKKISRI